MNSQIQIAPPVNVPNSISASGKTGDPVKPSDEESGLDSGFEAILNQLAPQNEKPPLEGSQGFRATGTIVSSSHKVELVTCDIASGSLDLGHSPLLTNEQAIASATHSQLASAILDSQNDLLRAEQAIMARDGRNGSIVSTISSASSEFAQTDLTLSSVLLPSEDLLQSSALLTAQVSNQGQVSQGVASILESMERLTDSVASQEKLAELSAGESDFLVTMIEPSSGNGVGNPDGGSGEDATLAAGGSNAADGITDRSANVWHQVQFDQHLQRGLAVYEERLANTGEKSISEIVGEIIATRESSAARESNVTQVKIEISPAEFGEITIQITKSVHGTVATLAVANELAMNQLQSNIQSLQLALEDMGVEFQQIDWKQTEENLLQNEQEQSDQPNENSNADESTAPGQSGENSSVGNDEQFTEEDKMELTWSSAHVVDILI
jgi:hypothetical protein